MNFIGLVIHGLSAISVYVDVLTVRLIIASGAVILSGVIGIIILLYIKFLTSLAIPGWATTVAIGIVAVTFQAITFLTVVSFIVLNYRSMKLFIPAKDYMDYVQDLETIIAHD